MATKRERRSQTVAPRNDYEINYIAPPVLERFIRCDAKIVGARGPYRCLAGDHEVLTRTGWVRIDQWDGQDILVYSPEVGEFYERPAAYIRERAGEMIRLHGADVDQLVSPGHRIPYVKTLHPYVVRVATAEDIALDHERIPGGWDGLLLSKQEDRSKSLAPIETVERTVSPDGYQYCFTTSTGFFITRRGGKVCVTGNSGKSSACCMKIFRHLCEQRRSRDGYRRSRWAIIRRDYPKLRTTALKTWLDWFPTEHFGELVEGIPIIYYFHFGDVRAEIMFLALDRAADTEKLASLELTGAWVNEAQEVAKPIIDHLIGRVGQYPAKKDGGPSWHGVIMDTNPPDEDHWWPRMFGDAPEAEEAPDWRGDPLAEQYPDLLSGENDKVQFIQPSGLHPDAENLENLNQGRAYYVDLARNNPRDFVRVYVHGQYGSAADGKLVYPHFSAEHHVADEPLEPNDKLPLFLGWDFGLTPACVIAQVTPRFQLRVLREICSDDLDVHTFADMVVRWHLHRDFANYEIISTGDPAGSVRSQTDKRSCFDVLKAAGMPTQPAHTQSIIDRIAAVDYYIHHSPGGGEPGIILDPSCKRLRHGFVRAYKYKRVRVEGEDRFDDAIDKRGNLVTHPHDALQYLCLRVAKENRWNKAVRAWGRTQPYQPADPVAGI